LKLVTPGERVGVIEEYEPGEGTYVVDGVIYSSRLGFVEVDKERRIVVKGKRLVGVPEVGDEVIVKTTLVQRNIVNGVIIFINGVEVDSCFVALLLLRGAQKKIFVGDLIRARVISRANGVVHVSVRGPEMGVVQTVCNHCGGKVVRYRANAVKCVECGAVEERLLSKEFGRFDLPVLKAYKRI